MMVVFKERKKKKAYYSSKLRLQSKFNFGSRTKLTEGRKKKKVHQSIRQANPFSSRFPVTSIGPDVKIESTLGNAVCIGNWVRIQ